jgi:hypothetical protein
MRDDRNNGAAAAPVTPARNRADHDVLHDQDRVHDNAGRPVLSRYLPAHTLSLRTRASGYWLLGLDKQERSDEAIPIWVCSADRDCFAEPVPGPRGAPTRGLAMLGGRPPDGIGCWGRYGDQQRRRPHAGITIGLDIAKSVFQVHAEDTSGCKIVIQKRLRRGQVAGFFCQAGCTGASGDRGVRHGALLGPHTARLAI